MGHELDKVSEYIKEEKMSEQSSSCSSLTRSSKYGDALPVTVLTGFLGSGKTTLLNHVLRSKPDMRIAVIENEFGEVGIDNELVITTKKNLFELSDGCICCNGAESVRCWLLGWVLKKIVPTSTVIVEVLCIHYRPTEL